jgi:hypothetical protein
MLQGHIKLVQRYNMNSGAQTSEDSSELAVLQSYQRYSGDLEDKGGEVLPWS